MLYTSVVTLCLVCSLHCFEPVQCRSTRHLNEYSNRSSLVRRCLRSCFVISRHQTCFEKCLGKNNEGDFTDLNARILRINPPHLTPTFKRRKRFTEGRGILCPREAKGNNSFPTLRTPERNQYENSSKWYLNISWNSLPDSTNFTGYGIAYVCHSEEVFEEGFLAMPKNETFKIFNESDSCWSHDMDFYFIVLGLPCLKQERFPYEDLPWRRYSIEDVCNNYKIISGGEHAQGSVWQGNASCHWRLPPIAAWYRFQDATGDRIPDKCVPERRCGTIAPGWMNGRHPTVTEGVVTREVCYHFSKNCCYWSNNVSVKNCGGYFVYKLEREPYCITSSTGISSTGISSRGTWTHVSFSHNFCALSGHNGDCGSFCVQTMEKEKKKEWMQHS